MSICLISLNDQVCKFQNWLHGSALQQQAQLVTWCANSTSRYVRFSRYLAVLEQASATHTHILWNITVFTKHDEYHFCFDQTSRSHSAPLELSRSITF